MRPQRGMGLTKNVYNIKNTDKATLHSPIDAKAMPAPTSKTPEEREFVVDSRASMHVLSEKELSSEEVETLRRSRTPTTEAQANGEVQTKEETLVYVYDLALFVTVQLLEDKPAVLSLAKLCEEHGCTCQWASGQKPHLTKQGKKILCKTEFSCLFLSHGCRPWIVVKIWYQFVFYIATAGLTKNIFKSCNRAK